MVSHCGHRRASTLSKLGHSANIWRCRAETAPWPQLLVGSAPRGGMARDPKTVSHLRAVVVMAIESLCVEKRQWYVMTPRVFDTAAVEFISTGEY